MKIIAVDNFARENIADFQVPGMTGMTSQNAAAAVEWLNKTRGGEHSDHFYRAVEDDHKLWGGMKELV